MIPPPDVSPGDPILPAWKRLTAYVRSLVPLPGANTRITAVPGGYRIDYDPGDQTLDYPFRCQLQGTGVTITTGLIDSFVPTIAGVPISGVDASGNPIPGGVPVLTVDADLHDDEGRSWIAALCKFDAKTSAVSSAEIVQLDSWPQDLGATAAYCALAVLKLVQGQLTVVPYRYHNVAHYYITPAQGLARHFFVPA
jgi:hypothetical protein